MKTPTQIAAEAATKLAISFSVIAGRDLSPAIPEITKVLLPDFLTAIQQATEEGAKDSAVIESPAKCNKCGLILHATTTGKVLNRCLCGGTMHTLQRSRSPVTDAREERLEDVFAVEAHGSLLEMRRIEQALTEARAQLRDLTNQLAARDAELTALRGLLEESLHPLAMAARLLDGTETGDKSLAQYNRIRARLATERKEDGK